MAQALEMHVARAGGAEALQPRGIDLMPPAVGEVQVRIEAAGVAYADIVMRRGLYAGETLPVTPGYDFVGQVEAVGEGVLGLAVGQRVAGVTVSGSYASRRNVEARWLVPAPDNADPVELAAVVLNGLTAWQMLHRLSNARVDDWVLVHGAAGGVGTLLLDLARLAGLRTIGVASKAKHDVLRARGAIPIDYQTEDVARRATEISNGGVITALDHIGGAHLRKASIAALAETGTAILYGGYDATRGGRVNPLAVIDLLFNSRLSAHGLFGRSQSVASYSVASWRNTRTDLYRQDLAHLLDLVATGALKPLVSATLPLKDAAEAHRQLESRAPSGKLVLRP